MNNQPTISRLEQTPSLVRVASDELLLLGARLHDDIALGVLYDRYGGEVYGMAFEMLHQPEPAEAVMQDVFLRCWRGVELYDAIRGSTHDWLMGVTRRRAQDAVNALDALGERETVMMSLESAARRNDVGLVAPPPPSG